MVLYPECQRKAQEEVDRFVGPGRLPDFSDRDSLPYVECILQETLRWSNGVPHRSLEDDVYRGMLIPKGSIIIVNTRAISLDEKSYSNPHIFNRSR
ncbi:O-methylsterigmatocystin oxidoreductase [Termitomyces sp. J132]|nr:O-methylsterigmatocystin oxidoreductase [Termitomyces sp. J132]